jgi:putative ATP-dependent endonuclease of the OLD family
MGKYNIHRYINLCDIFGLSYSILMDYDEDIGIHEYVNLFIKNKAKRIYGFKDNFEVFLGIPSVQNYLKPINVLKNHHDGKITQTKISELKKIILELID